MTVWNSTSEAVAAFHTWYPTSNHDHHNVTIGDESFIDSYEAHEPSWHVIEIIFIRGNVTASLRCGVYPSADLGVGIEQSLMLALAQDMKILEVQAAIGQ